MLKMFLLDWFLASIRMISKKPLLFTTKIYSRQMAKAFGPEKSGSDYSCLSKMSCCPVIAPGLPRQRLDGLEIIVHCECEEDEEETCDEMPETSNEGDCFDDRISANLTDLRRGSCSECPALSESGCQTSRCDLSSYRECVNMMEPESDVVCANTNATCSSTCLNNDVLPNIKTPSAQTISYQAWLNYSGKASSFASVEEHCKIAQTAEEMWNKMTSIQKFPYFWDALAHDPITAKPFDNFSNYYKSKRRVSSPRAGNKIVKTWKRMTYKDRLPFIVESFIYKMKNNERCYDECCIREFFSRHRRLAKKKCSR